MKNLIKIIVASSIILLLLSCGDKYHRDRYTGAWEFVTIKNIKTYNNLHEIIEEKIDTVYYLGQISIGIEEDELIIQYTEDDVILTFINSTGEIFITDYPCAGGYCARGRFEENDKVNIAYGWDDNWSHIIVGTKKEGDRNE